MAMKANFYVENGTLAEFKEAVCQVLHGQTTFHWPLEFPEVFAVQRTVSPLTAPANGAVDSESALGESHPQTDSLRYNSGFDAFVCNPPFIGGKKITGNLGTSYRDYLVAHLANGARGNADLSAYFFLQAKRLLRTGGSFGLLATNTIAQGDTREVGLDQIVAASGLIYRAVPSRPWPGVASLEVAKVWLRNGGEWHGECFLDELPVTGITPFLTKPGRAIGNPHQLAANADKSFQGSIVLGMGFVLTPEEARALIAKDGHNRDVLFPYLNGEDLNSRPDQSPSRWVINFFDWPLERVSRKEWNAADEEQQRAWGKAGRVSPDYGELVAADYPDCLKVVGEKVKFERTRKNEEGGFALRYPLYLRWWIYADKRPLLYTTTAGMERVLVIAIVSRTVAFTLVPGEQVYAHKLAVIASQHLSDFAVLQSSMHYFWAWQYSSTMKTDLNYSPTDCFETFPFPEKTNSLEETGEQYHAHRQSIMLARQEGLTKTYNRFHDPEEASADIRRLRELHQQMDEAVAAAYGWTDLPLGHDFHATKQGVRFTINEAARREVLDRLLELNHRRYAEEVAAGLHDKGGKKKKAAGRKQSAAGSRQPESSGLRPEPEALFELDEQQNLFK